MEKIPKTRDELSKLFIDYDVRFIDNRGGHFLVWDPHGNLYDYYLNTNKWWSRKGRPGSKQSGDLASLLRKVVTFEIKE